MLKHNGKSVGEMTDNELLQAGLDLQGLLDKRNARILSSPKFEKLFKNEPIPVNPAFKLLQAEVAGEIEKRKLKVVS